MQHFEVEMLEEMLDSFDPSLIPRPSQIGVLFQHGASVAAALEDLAVILQVFESPMQGFSQLKENCLRSLLARWENMTRWMMYLLQRNDDNHRVRDLDVRLILAVIRSISAAPNVDLYKEEILSMDCTVDVLVASFVCKIPGRTNHLHCTTVAFPLDSSRPHSFARSKQVIQFAARFVVN